jgi:hypothetical protein
MRGQRVHRPGGFIGQPDGFVDGFVDLGLFISGHKINPEGIRAIRASPRTDSQMVQIRGFSDLGNQSHGPSLPEAFPHV